MTIEEIQKSCNKFAGVKEDIKWENHLCFTIVDKMFLVIGLDETPITASFKVNDEEFEALINRDGFIPAPYLARYKWVHTDNIKRLNKNEWEYHIRQSYELVKSKLPKKKLKELDE